MRGGQRAAHHSTEPSSPQCTTIQNPMQQVPVEQMPVSVAPDSVCCAVEALRVPEIEPGPLTTVTSRSRRDTELVRRGRSLTRTHRIWPAGVAPGVGQGPPAPYAGRPGAAITGACFVDGDGVLHGGPNYGGCHKNGSIDGEGACKGRFGGGQRQLTTLHQRPWVWRGRSPKAWQGRAGFRWCCSNF